MENLLRNGDFEADWGEEQSHIALMFRDGNATSKEIGNIFTPPGWMTWFKHQPGVWDQPEVTDVHRPGDPARVNGGNQAVRFFTFYRAHDGGFLQTVDVPDYGPVTVFLRSRTVWQFKHNDAYWDDVWLHRYGNCLSLAAYCHAWSNSPVQGFAYVDNGRYSVGVDDAPTFIPAGDTLPPTTGNPLADAIPNFTFWIGLDLTGGHNPYSLSVTWSRGAHVYNQYAPLFVTAPLPLGEQGCPYGRTADKLCNLLRTWFLGE